MGVIYEHSSPHGSTEINARTPTYYYRKLKSNKKEKDNFDNIKSLCLSVSKNFLFTIFRLYPVDKTRVDIGSEELVEDNQERKNK